MPASTFARPTQLNLCGAEAPRFTRAPWSTGGSDSDEDETTSADSNGDADNDDEPSFDGPSTATTSAQAMAMRRAPALPAISVSARSVSPPRRSPLSPLAAGAGTVAPGVARPRPRGLGMSPLSSNGAPSPRACLPKATPLSRTLLNRTLPSTATAPKKTTKFIVPSKPFRSTFELGLSSTELARK